MLERRQCTISKCGRFAVQLDSDDLYKDETTLQKVVDVFRKEKCAMVIGSYQMTNFELQEIPPGVIDHKEWTPDNGRNNALRINGLGAPRAFYTPLLRKINVPNVSYGEDYAVGLAISREYQIGRIYEPIYLCRRWEGNTDADIDITKQNTFNAYKDKLRTFEILARQRKNAGSRRERSMRVDSPRQDAQSTTCSSRHQQQRDWRCSTSRSASGRCCATASAALTTCRRARSRSTASTSACSSIPQRHRFDGGEGRSEIDRASGSAFSARRICRRSSAASRSATITSSSCNPFPIFPRAFHDPAPASTCRSGSPTSFGADARPRRARCTRATRSSTTARAAARRRRIICTSRPATGGS